MIVWLTVKINFFHFCKVIIIFFQCLDCFLIFNILRGSEWKGEEKDIFQDVARVNYFPSLSYEMSKQAGLLSFDMYIRPRGMVCGL